MDDEIQLRIDQLEEIGSQNTTLIGALDASRDPHTDIKVIKSRLHDYSNALDTFKMEIRTPEGKAKYQAQSKQFTDTFKQHKAEVALIEAGLAKRDLLDGASASEQSEEALIDHGLKTMSDSRDTLYRVLGTVGEAQKVGTDTAAMLSHQQDQLDKMHEDLNTVSSSLARSKRTVSRISRKVMTDKYLWCLAFIVVALIVALIVWKAVAPSAANQDINIPGSMQLRQ